MSDMKIVVSGGTQTQNRYLMNILKESLAARGLVKKVIIDDPNGKPTEDCQHLYLDSLKNVSQITIKQEDTEDMNIKSMSYEDILNRAIELKKKLRENSLKLTSSEYKELQELINEIELIKITIDRANKLINSG